MKKLVLALISPILLSSFIANANSQDRSSTIKINLESLPQQVIEQIKPESKDLVRSNFDLTKVVVFVRDWKDNEARKDKLMTICSKAASEAFKKYPESKEFEFSTYINYKNRTSQKSEIKNISKIVITKENFNKIDWKNVNQDSRKYFKVMDFSNL